MNRLELSASGADTLDQMTPQAQVVQEELLAPLPAGDSERLLLCLHRVAFGATE